MSGIEWWLSCGGIGALVGVLAGMLGIGGGAITVPLLAALFEAQGLPRSQILHLAVGTAMAAILFTSTSSVRAHHVRGAVRWDVLRRITPGILVGGLAGSAGAGLISSRGLALFFTLLIYAMGTNMWLDRKPRATRELPGAVGMFTVGAVISGLSSLVAIGGAAMTIPFMLFCNVQPLHAVGTASAIGFPIALAGTIGYVGSGTAAGGLPPWSLGYVYLPALAGMTAAGVLTAPLGARLAHRLPTKRLKQSLAVLLFLLATHMLIRFWT